MARGKAKSSTTGANLGFEDKLWSMADSLRGSMDASDYKHIVLGMIFLKYVSDRFQERRLELTHEAADPRNDNYIDDPAQRDSSLEDRDQYAAKNVFWVPTLARWSYLQSMAKQEDLGKTLDDAMIAIEKENPSLLGVLPKEYAKHNVDQETLARLIDITSTIGLTDTETGVPDLIGTVYQYFLKKFARQEGKDAGEFYTPSCVVDTLVEMLSPYKGRVYDPCNGSGGMFVSSDKFRQAHGGRQGILSIFGQEKSYTTWRLAKMNLAIRGIDADLGKENHDTFTRDLHPDLRADYVLANPPFNQDDWYSGALADDKRWKEFGLPPKSNANYAWIEHIIYHLAPHGEAGFVLANGSMSSNTAGEGKLRRKIIEADLVDCMVYMPDKLFFTASISVCLWFLARYKGANQFHDRRKMVLFIDARKMGTMVDRTHRELAKDDIQKIAGTYHAWRGDPDSGEYADVAGFCKSATIEEIEAKKFVLTPSRYVNAEEVEVDGEPFDTKMKRLVVKLKEQQSQAKKLDTTTAKNLYELGYDD